MGTIGKTIRRLREDRQWTQQELGARVGKSDSTICKIERGQRRMTLEDLGPFLMAFGISLDGFLRRHKLVRREEEEADGGRPNRPSTHEVREALEVLQRYLAGSESS